MSYKPIPYTYGTKTLAEIEALTGMQEGDTVYNTTWQIIEIYSGTNWVNNQSVEYLTRSVAEIPKSGTIPSGDRVGDPYPDDGGYNIAQHSNGTVQLGTSNETYTLGAKIRGTSANGSQDRIVVAFSGKWPLFISSQCNKGWNVSLNSIAGNFDAQSTGINEEHIGFGLEDGSGSSDTYRNHLCVLQTVEMA
tara:strand:- start:174 stop:749 length:576 start_codon:yes stop_codon:yes gene_type:complete